MLNLRRIVVLTSLSIVSCATTSLVTESWKTINIDLGESTLSLRVPAGSTGGFPAIHRPSVKPGDEYESAVEDSYFVLYSTGWEYRSRALDPPDGSITVKAHLWAAPEGLGEQPSLDALRVALIERRGRHQQASPRKIDEQEFRFKTIAINNAEWLSYRMPVGPWRRWSLAYPIDSTRYIDIHIGVTPSNKWRDDALSAAHKMMASITIGPKD